MNRCCIRASRHARWRAVGSLMLVLPAVGCTLQLSPAQAQPQVAKVPTSNLSPEQKATVEKMLAIAHQEEICKTRLDLKVNDATLDDVIKSIKDALPGQKVEVNVRDASPVRLSFDLKQAPVGDILQSAAALSGGQLWVTENGLLIARPLSLSETEQAEMKKGRSGQWLKSTEAGGSGWSNSSISAQMFATAIAQEVKNGNFKTEAPGEVKTVFGNFSPDAQRMLQQLATWTRDDTRTTRPNAPAFILGSNSPITVDTSNPKKISIQFQGNASDPAIGAMSMGIRYLPISQ